MPELNKSDKWDAEEKGTKLSDKWFEENGYKTVFHFKSSDLESPCIRCGFQALGNIYVNQFEKYGGLCRECYET